MILVVWWAVRDSNPDFLLVSRFGSFSPTACHCLYLLQNQDVSSSPSYRRFLLIPLNFFEGYPQFPPQFLALNVPL